MSLIPPVSLVNTPAELPHTGFPAAMLAFVALNLIGAGIVLVRRHAAS